MSDIDEVLQRLDDDPGFRSAVVRDPKGALQDFDLSADDLSALATQLSSEQEALDPVEQRTSKAGLFALFTSAMAREQGTGPTVRFRRDQA